MNSELFWVRLADGRQFGPSTLDVIEQWTHERRVPSDAWLVPADGGPPRPVASNERLAGILNTPPTLPVATTPPVGPAAPAAPAYRPPEPGNTAADVAYYTGIFSCGLPLIAPVTLMIGIAGLIVAAPCPGAGGHRRSIIGMVLSVVSPLVWLLAIVPLTRGWYIPGLS